ncbi:probable proteasome subunit beta type-2 [Drosophila subpulchrella]|uniref:probable proteasome subunit beta type-2 n=1 Tax=Drosophila subpulchrella TaxID=1486046 RepID=UPI0018A19A64|nr:probable proteasome subunit beta type-2 [Drosophila subpulchrella]
METILGIRGVDFVILASDTMKAKAVMWLDEDKSKIHRLTNFSMMSAVGDGGDCLQFSDFILRNLDLYKVTNGYDLTVRGAVHFIRTNLSAYLRSNVKYMVALLVGGFDHTSGPELTYIDSFGNSVPIRYGGHGSGINFCTPIFEEFYNPQLDKRAAYNIMEKCVFEIQKRFVINLRNFDVFMINREGITKLDSINQQSFRARVIANPPTRE